MPPVRLVYPGVWMVGLRTAKPHNCGPGSWAGIPLGPYADATAGTQANRA